jgi:hypothetical protein
MGMHEGLEEYNDFALAISKKTQKGKVRWGFSEDCYYANLKTGTGMLVFNRDNKLFYADSNFHVIRWLEINMEVGEILSAAIHSHRKYIEKKKKRGSKLKKALCKEFKIRKRDLKKAFETPTDPVGIWKTWHECECGRKYKPWGHTDKFFMEKPCPRCGNTYEGGIRIINRRRLRNGSYEEKVIEDF